jgi:hypothetical protein
MVALTDKEKCEIILLSEIGVLLHDLGKFSKVFIGGKVKGTGITSIPHNLLCNLTSNDDPDDPFMNDALAEVLCKERGIFKKIETENREPLNCLLDFITLHHPNKLRKIIDEPLFRYSSFPISNNQLNKSNHPETEDFFPWLGLMTIMADTLDSGIDKAFPQEDQSGADNIWISSPFGIQKEKIDLNELEMQRKEFQKKLADQLKEIDKDLPKRRKEIYKLIEQYWRKSLGETRIPSNDVRLHEHAISTATIFKAELSRRLIEKNMEMNWYDASKIKFQIVAIQWSWWDVTGRAFKLPDIVGRSDRLNNVKNKLKKYFQEGVIEGDPSASFIPIGNAVYDDHNGIYFLIGSINPNKEEGKAVYERIKQETDKFIDDQFAGEVAYRIARLKTPTKSLTHLTYLTGNEKDKIEVIGEGPSPDVLAALWAESQNGETEICQVCRIRPIVKREEIAVGDDNYTKISRCKLCDLILKTKPSKPKFKKESNDLENIRDEHRVALISLKLDITQWLGGKAFYSVFSNRSAFSDPKNILKEQLKHSPQFGTIDFNDQEGALSLIEKIFEVKGNNSRTRSGLRSVLEIPSGGLTNEEQVEYIKKKYSVFSNITLKKIFENYTTYCNDNKIPNEVEFYLEYLNVGYHIDPPLQFNWKIQSKDYNGVLWLEAKEKDEKAKLEKISWIMIRRQLEDCWQFAGFGGKPDDLEKLKTALAMKYPSPSRLLRIINEVKAFTKDAITELNSMAEENNFHFRSLISSPIFLQVLLPANKAREYLEKINCLYRQYFGLVTDRLPIHARTVYFYYKTPLYIVMDAARRMFQEDKLLQNQKDKFRITENKDYNYIEFTFEGMHNATLPVNLEKAHPKYYANYRIHNESDSGKLNALKNIQTINPEDLFACLSSTYDAIFLDTTTRRYDLFYKNSGQDRSYHMLGERPLSLLPFWQLNFYKEIMTFLGDDASKIKNLQGLFIEKHMNWGIENDGLLKRFFEDCLANLYGKKWMGYDKKELILDFAIQGRLFDVIEQKLFIEVSDLRQSRRLDL